MALKASTAIYIDKFHPKANQECAISIRVTYDRIRKYYPTPYSLTIADFEKVMGDKPRQPFKDFALQLQAYEKKASDIIKDLQSFSFPSFEKRYLTNKNTQLKINSAFDDYINALKNNEQIGTAVSYECSKNSINKFAPDVSFLDVTSDFLKKYESWMLRNGKSITTVGIYLRQLRTLFNIAKSEEIITSEHYPFGKRKYEIPTGKNTKKALTLSDIENIFNYIPKPNSTSERARDFWIFIYLCNGMNVKDFCLLKYENIKGDFIHFERAKTSRTKRTVEPITIHITDDVISIIHKHGNRDKSPDNYIFPILTPSLNATRQRQLIQQLTSVINDHMKIIAGELGIKISTTTYVARHSFATVLKRSGMNTSFIKEALGHSSEKTTENYLAGFENNQKMEAAKALTAFKNTGN